MGLEKHSIGAGGHGGSGQGLTHAALTTGLRHAGLPFLYAVRGIKDHGNT